MADNQEQADAAAETQLPLEGPGDKLRLAREKSKLTLEQVAAETRVPLRQLELIEAGKFEELPGRTYAIGFSRNFATTVGLDGEQIADEVREQLGTRDYSANVVEDGFEPGDPARVPSRGLAWFGLFAAVLLIAGLFVFYNTIFAPGSGPASILSGEDNAQIAAQAEDSDAVADEPAVSAAAPVTLTATREVWLRIYDANYDETREPLLEKVMVSGESFTIPAGADGPQIRTGFPAALEVSVGGRDLGPLSLDDETLSDVDMTGPALVARIRDRPTPDATETDDDA